MHEQTSSRIASLAKRVREATLEILWKQWASVGSPASARGGAQSIIDPEALVLTSLALREQERRLWDLVADWARVGSRFLSVQRIGNLLPAYPDATRGSLEEFASLAQEAGKDHRWKKYAQGVVKVQPHREKLLASEPSLVEGSTLMLRLRSGIGVGIKADMLAFLIGCAGSSISAKMIADATHYTEPAVRRAADDMTTAQLVFSSQGTPAEYHVIRPAWKKLLALKEYPAWMYWHEVFALAAQFLIWEHETHTRTVSEYARQVRYRQFFSEHRTAFSRHGLAPDVQPRTGELIGPGEFEELLVQLMGKTGKSV
ncbi:MAG: hypothetical protein JSV86_14400 [Gemmatimonadota bacterium]|nr:MAG: hypothetical protein JSV86_14400 [Gemmatimonadota bacterium]